MGTVNRAVQPTSNVTNLQRLLTLMAMIAVAYGSGDRVSQAQPRLWLAHEPPSTAPDANLLEMNPTASPSGSHPHGTVEAEQPVPTVELIVHPDARQGWNLEVQVTHFRFAPEQVNQANTPQAGHAHLYINGDKITRLYGSWYYLESLPAGQHELTVQLNTNEHDILTNNGQPIESTVVLEVP